MRRGGLVLDIRRPRLILLRFKAAAAAAVVEAIVGLLGWKFGGMDAAAVVGLPALRQGGARLRHSQL